MIWDAEACRMTMKLHRESLYVAEAALSRDGNTLVTANGTKGHAYLWDVRNGQVRSQSG